MSTVHIHEEQLSHVYIPTMVWGSLIEMSGVFPDQRDIQTAL
jgi:hypothetical protein